MRTTKLLGQLTAEVRAWARRDQVDIHEETQRLVAAGLLARSGCYTVPRVYAGRGGVPKVLIAIRIEAALLAQVDVAAAASGTTRTGEILRRLQRSYAAEAWSAAHDRNTVEPEDAEECNTVEARGDGSLLGVGYPAGDVFDELEQEAVALGAVPVESS
jgi:hypothetical protein